MLHGSPNPGVAGSELTRLLAALAPHPGAGIRSANRAAFADRVGAWLGWTGAISLSAALGAGPAVPVAGASKADAAPASAPGRAAADLHQVRTAQAAAIAAGADETEPSPTDFGPYRRHCLARQQAMQDAVAALRQRLREALARQSAPGAQLAAIDAVMEQALTAQERSLLGLVPLRLQAHFDRLRHPAAGDMATDSRWLPAFCHDMQQLLLAELAHRLLPAQGLLDTLSPHAPT